MKHKKLPVWLCCVLGLALAIICIGSTWLIACAIADPELFEEVTTPWVEFATEQVDKAERQVQKLHSGLLRAGDAVSLYFSDKKQEIIVYLEEKEVAKEQQKIEEEELAQELLVELRDNQAYQESLLKAPRAIADDNITSFQVNEFTGLEVLVGGSLPLVYFNQMDSQWGNYGTDSIYGYGCGPTAMAMIVSTFHGNYITPQEMADIFVEEGYWAHDSGTYYTFGHGCAELFDLGIETLLPEETTAEDLIGHLMKGDFIIALMSQGHFTNGGHYIVLRGATLSGEVLVADPASRERSLTTWDPQLILDELSASRYHGAPLWVFSNAAPSFTIIE